MKIWLGLLLFLLPLFGESKLQILVINSYHRGFQWSDDVIKGIEKSFADKSKIETSVLYMDSKRIHSNEYFESLSQLYRLQFKGRKYDLIIAVDNFAFEFVTEHYEDMFKNEPVLFTGLERFDADRLERLGLSDKVFGLLERRAIPENIQIATKLFPNLKELYIINDISKNGDDSEGFIREAIAEFSPHLEINYIRSSTREEILETFSHYNPSRAILFVRFYQD
ncbi:MAG: sensor histidine kinase, partial [Wolinella sp.]